MNIDILGLGKHGDRRRGGVDAPLSLGLRYPLHTMRAAFELEYRVGAVTLDRKRVLAVPLLERLEDEAETLGVAREHAVDGTALDLDDHMLVVVGVALHHRDPDLFLDLLDSLARAGEQIAQLAIVGPVGQELLGTRGVIARMAPLGGEPCRRLELAVGAPNLGEPIAIREHRGVGHLR